MVLDVEQNIILRKLCEEIKPGEYGRVTVEFIGQPNNCVRICGEKTYRFHSEKSRPTIGDASDRQSSGRM